LALQVIVQYIEKTGVSRNEVAFGALLERSEAPSDPAGRKNRKAKSIENPPNHLLQSVRSTTSGRHLSLRVAVLQYKKLSHARVESLW